MSRQTAEQVLEINEKVYRDCDAGRQKVGFRRDGDGELWLDIDGEACRLGRVASPFPLSAPLDMVALFDPDGNEIGILKNVRQLDRNSCRILTEALDKAYFMPKIERITGLVDQMGMERWEVRTDRGEHVFEVRNPRRNVRFLTSLRMMIKDVDGNRYEIVNWRQLDRRSRQLLTRHL